MAGFEHQDWTPTVLKKFVPQTKTVTVKPHTTNNGPKVTYEDGEEQVTIKKVTKEMAKTISDARNLKKLTQIQLAQQCKLDKAIINQIEQANCIYNAQQINAIAKVLGIKIARP